MSLKNVSLTFHLGGLANELNWINSNAIVKFETNFRYVLPLYFKQHSRKLRAPNGTQKGTRVYRTHNDCKRSQSKDVGGVSAPSFQSHVCIDLIQCKFGSTQHT